MPRPSLGQVRAKKFSPEKNKNSGVWGSLNQIKCGLGQYFPTKIIKIVEFLGIWKSGAIILIVSSIIKMKLKLKLMLFILAHFFSCRTDTSMVYDVDQEGLKLKIHESQKALQKV